MTTPTSYSRTSSGKPEARAFDVGVLVLPVVGAVLLPGVSVGRITLDNVFVIIFIGVYSVRLLGSGGLLFGRGARPFIFLTFVAGVSALVTETSGAAVLRFLSYALFVDGVRRLGLAHRPRLVRSTVVVSSLAAISVVIDRIGLVSFRKVLVDAEGGVIRAGGVVGHPNFAAYVLALGLLALLFLNVDFSRRTLIRLILLHVGALAATAARTALLALGVALLIASARSAKRLLLLAAGSAVFLATVGRPLLRRFDYFGESGGLRGQNAAGWRIAHWSEVLTRTDLSPFFGIGWNQTQTITQDGLAAHNGFLQVAVELGLLAVVALVLSLIFLYRANSALPRHLRLSFLAYLVVIAIGDPGLLYPAVFYPACVYLLLGRQSEARSSGTRISS